MKDDIIDEIIKNKLKDIEAPKELRDKIHKEICDLKPKKKRYIVLKSMVHIAAMVMISVAFLSATTYTITSGRLNLFGLGVDKLYKNYDENDSLKVNAVIESEYYKITLDTVTAYNSYLVLNYTIELTEDGVNELGEIGYRSNGEYTLGISYAAFANYDNTYKSIYGAGRCEKIGERKYSLVNVCNIANIDVKKFEVEIGLGELYNYNDDYDWKDWTKVLIDKRIKFNLTVPEDVDENNLFQEQVIDDKTKIVLTKIYNTKVSTFIIAKVIYENITYKEYEKIANDYSFILMDDSGKEVPVNWWILNYDIDMNLFVREADGNMRLVEIDEAIKNDYDIIIEKNFILSFGETENLKNINVYPISTKFYEKNWDEWKNAYHNAKWYPVIVGEENKYYAKSGLGGTVELYKIEQNDEGIVFYYNEYGRIGNEGIVTLRCKHEKNRSIVTGGPWSITKGENGIGNKLTIFYEGGYRGLKNLDELEFTMFLERPTKFVGNVFKVTIPEQRDGCVEIDSFKMEELIETERYKYWGWRIN